MKIEPKKFEKETITKEKSDIKEFMIDEYKKSEHYKKKLENYKINKIMGRIKKKANGPNPLSCKKKKSFYESRENKNFNRENTNNKFNESDRKVENKFVGREDGNTENQEFLKKKRKRKRKNKQN